MALAVERGLPGAGAAGRVYARVFQTGRLEPEAAGVSAASAPAWRTALRAGLLEVHDVVEEPGPLGLTAKAVMITNDGKAVECVRVPVRTAAGTDRYTLCVSSQVGCGMGCAFCETGRRGLERNLSPAEIVAQVVTARCVLGWVCRNVVFMGMGEPLDNLEGVAQALRVLTDNRGLRYAWERITVCTSGPPGGVTRLKELAWKRLNLSVSLNTADGATRATLMPSSAGLAALAAELAAYPQRRGFALGVNYCLLPGINDTPADARDVAVWLRGVGRAQLNVIPYNPGSFSITRAPTDEEIDRFVSCLAAAGVDARLRAPRGRGIMAGCGQLGNQVKETNR